MSENKKIVEFCWNDLKNQCTKKISSNGKTIVGYTQPRMIIFNQNSKNGTFSMTSMLEPLFLQNETHIHKKD